MPIRLEEVALALRRAGFSELSRKAQVELSDPVELADLEKFLEPYGISRGTLMDRLGGSP